MANLHGLLMDILMYISCFLAQRASAQSHLHYVSYTLYCLSEMAEKQRIQRESESIQLYFRRLFADSDQYQCLISGSTIEGLSCHGIGSSDVDLMYVIPAQFEIEDTYRPGYAYLTSSVDDCYLGVVSQRRNSYISSESFRKLLEKDVGRLHGPATEIIRGSWMMDIVYCFHYLPWPKLAEPFLHRCRSSGWPNTATIRKIQSQGCHFVPVAHPFSNKQHIEWRYSFSRAEITLAQTLTSCQRSVYVWTKLVLKNAFRETHGFTSYYLKTILFWSCEKRPSEYWSLPNFANCFYNLIDELRMCFENGYLPSYFIVENNLLSHLSQADRRPMVHILALIRQNKWDDINVFYHSNGNEFLSKISKSIGSKSLIPVNQSLLHQCLCKMIYQDMWIYIWLFDNLLRAFDEVRNYVSIFSKLEVSFLHYIYLNFIHFFQMKKAYNFKTFRILHDLPIEQKYRNNLVWNMYFKIQQSMPSETAKIYYSVLLYLTGQFKAARETSFRHLFPRSITRDEELVIMDPFVSLCPFLDEIRKDESQIYCYASEFHAYVYVKSCKQLDRPANTRLVYNVYRSMLFQGSRTVSERNNYQFASTFIDANAFLLAIYELLYSPLYTDLCNRYIFICLLLELLSIPANGIRVELAKFTKVVVDVVGCLKSDSYTDDNKDIVLEVLLGVARIYRSARSYDSSYLQCKCMIFYSFIDVEAKCFSEWQNYSNAIIHTDISNELDGLSVTGIKSLLSRKSVKNPKDIEKRKLLLFDRYIDFC